ncbi:MAG: SIMPL domain-containing protein [bacterium]|nr:SIMPL domain-containing protein [bacterium]
MTESLKKYLTLTVMLALAVFAYASVHYVLAYAKASQPTSYRSFSVSGEGTSSVIPDIARFSFGVITQGGLNLGELQEQNAAKVNAALEFLKGQGIAAEDITTQGYYVEPRYQYYSCFEGTSSCPPADIVGYTVNQQVSVKVRDFALLGGLLSGVVENGANSVSQLSFTVDDPTAVQNEARTEAIEKAQAKAEAIAEAAAFRVGRLISIQESGSPYLPYSYVTSEGRGGAGPVAPDIEPGSQDVNVTVTLVYEIK